MIYKYIYIFLTALWSWSFLSYIIYIYYIHTLSHLIMLVWSCFDDITKSLYIYMYIQLRITTDLQWRNPHHRSRCQVLRASKGIEFQAGSTRVLRYIDGYISNFYIYIHIYLQCTYIYILSIYFLNYLYIILYMYCIYVCVCGCVGVYLFIYIYIHIVCVS